jgi:hypothetical protein
VKGDTGNPQESTAELTFDDALQHPPEAAIEASARLGTEGREQLSVGGEDSQQLAQRGTGIVDRLEHPCAHDDVEAPVAKG